MLTESTDSANISEQIRKTIHPGEIVKADWATRLLSYIQNEDRQRYQALIRRLGIRG